MIRYTLSCEKAHTFEGWFSKADDFATIRKRYRSLAAEHHPDRLHARGVPVEFHAAANHRMARLNAAYAAIEKERRAA